MYFSQQVLPFLANFQNNLQESLHIVSAPDTLHTWAGTGIFDQLDHELDEGEQKYLRALASKAIF